MANTKISADQVEELLLKGKSHGGVLTYREIMDSMQKRRRYDSGRYGQYV